MKKCKCCAWVFVKEFVINEAQTTTGAAYQCLEPSVKPLSIGAL